MPTYDATMIRALSTDELTILEALLADPFPGRDQLRAQLPFTQAEGTSDSNTIHLAVDRSSVPPAEVIEVSPTGGYGYNSDGLLLGAVVCVADGYLDSLQYWSPSGAATSGPVRPETFQLGGWSPREEDGFRHMDADFLDTEMPDREPDKPDQH
jgi:hypothetical protein